jgi:hypothetical protein
VAQEEEQGQKVGQRLRSREVGPCEWPHHCQKLKGRAGLAWASETGARRYLSRRY